MDGLRATRIIKSDQELRTIPVFAITGFAMEADRENAMELGFADYIVKPFKVKTLLEKIARHFGDGSSDH